MTDAPAHTPLPWDACQGGACRCGQIWSISADQQVAKANDEWGDDVDFPYGAVGRVQQAANAAFIVRACNSHYQLVESLRGIIDHFDCSHGNAPGHDHLIPGVWDKDVSNGVKGGTKCGWCEQWNEARAALSQAGGAGE